MYADELLRLDAIVERIIRDAFSTKPVDWEYESEVRLVIQNSKDDAVFYNYPPEAVRRVIVGERATADDRD